jgi:hypothetical protein
MCRRESGASSLVFVGYRRADVSVDGTLKYYRSSGLSKRGFCLNCGSPICYEDDADQEFIWITAGTHDDAASLPKLEHVYVDDKLPWVDISGDFVQWPDERAHPRNVRAIVQPLRKKWISVDDVFSPKIPLS